MKPIEAIIAKATAAISQIEAEKGMPKATFGPAIWDGAPTSQYDVSPNKASLREANSKTKALHKSLDAMVPKIVADLKDAAANRDVITLLNIATAHSNTLANYSPLGTASRALTEVAGEIYTQVALANNGVAYARLDWATKEATMKGFAE